MNQIDIAEQAYKKGFEDGKKQATKYVFVLQKHAFPEVIESNFFDKEEIIEGCTVQILTNTVTGETSMGWWHGTAADMPGIETREDES